MNRRTVQQIILLGMGLLGGFATPAVDEAALRLPVWDYSLSLRGGAGYKDNVMLANLHPRGAMFMSVGADAMLLRLPIDGPEVTVFASVDDRRYDLKEVDYEDTVVALAQIKQAIGNHWTAGAGIQYLFQDQVLDISTLESGLTTAKIQGHSLSARPNARWTFWPHYYVEGEFAFTRQYFISPLDDYWEGGPKITAGHEYGHGSELTASYALNHRSHDDRPAMARDGSRLDGRSLEVKQHTLEWALRHYWDARKRWRTTTKLVFEVNADNGGSFYDYLKYQAGQQVQYKTKLWLAKAQARINFYDYRTRAVSADDPSRKYYTSLLLNVRGQRKLGKHLVWFAEYEHERAVSNQREIEYTVNTLWSGLELEY